MRRKSERNKAKSTPEKKVEKPASRRTTRRRGKVDVSPEVETTEDNASSAPCVEVENESIVQSSELTNDNQEIDKGVSSSELIKSVLGGDEEDNGSVWKVARADASPGEIQKLKLCRQRNISEASDSSVGKKKSNKWQDSGEGGTEEADSAEEPIASSQKMLISEQTDDPSSLPPGQDSNEEVSDYKENLPETTSANLSDDKTNIDQPADSQENLPEATSCLSEPMYEGNQSSTNQLDASESLDQLPNQEEHLEEPSIENSQDQQSKEYQQFEEIQQNSGGSNHFNTDEVETQQLVEDNSTTNNESTDQQISVVEGMQINEATENSIENCNDKVPVEESESKQYSVLSENTENEDSVTEAVLTINNESVDKNFEVSQSHSNDEEEEDGEIREETIKEPSPESDSASNAKDDSDTQDHKKKSLRSKRQKRNKYDGSSSDSDSPDSDNDMKRKKVDSFSVKTAEENGNDYKEKQSTNAEKRSSMGPDVELSESNIDKEDILEINEKTDDLNVSLSTSKPSKVSLKRSFSTRLSTDSSETKKEENSTRRLSTTETNQNKENHADNDQPDKKNTTKRRRWGTSTSTDVAPAFSISTDSLKALVPGAKPLSVNEVKLTKDEDEKEHRKSKNEVSGDHKSKHDNKNDTSKKNDKSENHITKRKISVVKETPRPKSPSPPEAQATNILLIRNLVRPFTLNQIKELLSRTGTIVENGFWMDKIKSKCFVEYTNEDQAFETRQALHGVSWPLSNPKKLIVEYSTKEDMEMARESSMDQPTVRKTEPAVSTDLWQQDQWSRDERPVITVIREWDLGKEDGQSTHAKEKERERKDIEKKKRRRSRSPTQEKHLPAPARKFKKKEEDPPTAKLLDDLFKKTKATPCIYWLPLTNEQIIIKEEMRRQHMAEHARRLEEMRRRDSRRRRSPRK